MRLLKRMLGGASAADTVRDRQSTHGNYQHRAQVVDGIIQEMERSPYWDTLQPTTRQSLRMMADKMSRIIEGNEAERDHYVDIGGYALLALQATQGSSIPNSEVHSHVTSTDNAADEELPASGPGEEDTSAR